MVMTRAGDHGYVECLEIETLIMRDATALLARSVWHTPSLDISDGMNGRNMAFDYYTLLSHHHVLFLYLTFTRVINIMSISTNYDAWI
jgi:hypothetical protein